MARPRCGVRRMALGLILAAGLGTVLGVLGGARAFALGETGGSPSETGKSNCPSSNPPNQMTLLAGTPQTTTLQSAFASGLQVVLSNSDGCPVTGAAGVPVTFSAPTSGPSGVFSASNSSTVTVGSDASGNVEAPTFTANASAGSYTVTASSQYGSVSFSLTNTAAGIPAQLDAIPMKSRSADVSRRYSQPLQVRVLDASGNPVPGVSVTFTLGSGGTSACGASTTASANFNGSGASATASTGANGVASSPVLTANTAAGSFTATASISNGGGAGMESAGKTGTTALTPVSFSLVNLAGKPAKIVPGVGLTQAVPAGAAFPIRLAVTVTDSNKNPVAGTLVTFSAPTTGASGRFTLRRRGASHQRPHVSYVHTVKVRTSACGVAVAPAFTATHRPGGYIVKATSGHAKAAAFALVNETP